MESWYVGLCAVVSCRVVACRVVACGVVCHGWIGLYRGGVGLSTPLSSPRREDTKCFMGVKGIGPDFWEVLSLEPASLPTDKRTRMSRGLQTTILMD